MKKIAISLLVFAGVLNAMSPQEVALMAQLEAQRDAAYRAARDTQESINSGTSANVHRDSQAVVSNQQTVRDLGDRLGYPPSTSAHNSHTSQQGPGPDDQAAYQKSLDSCKK